MSGELLFTLCCLPEDFLDPYPTTTNSSESLSDKSTSFNEDVTSQHEISALLLEWASSNKKWDDIVRLRKPTAEDIDVDCRIASTNQDQSGGEEDDTAAFISTEDLSHVFKGPSSSLTNGNCQNEAQSLDGASFAGTTQVVDLSAYFVASKLKCRWLQEQCADQNRVRRSRAYESLASILGNEHCNIREQQAHRT